MNAPEAHGTGEGVSPKPVTEGLVSCPINARPFPSQQSVDAAAEAFPTTDGDSIGSVTVSPGIIRLHVPQGDCSTGGGPRGVISDWSKKSRTSMGRRFCFPRLLSMGRASRAWLSSSDAHAHLSRRLAVSRSKFNSGDQAFILSLIHI